MNGARRIGGKHREEEESTKSPGVWIIGRVILAVVGSWVPAPRLPSWSGSEEMQMRWVGKKYERSGLF